MQAGRPHVHHWRLLPKQDCMYSCCCCPRTQYDGAGSHRDFPAVRQTPMTARTSQPKPATRERWQLCPDAHCMPSSENGCMLTWHVCDQRPVSRLCRHGGGPPGQSSGCTYGRTDRGRMCSGGGRGGRGGRSDSSGRQPGGGPGAVSATSWQFSRLLFRVSADQVALVPDARGTAWHGMAWHGGCHIQPDAWGCVRHVAYVRCRWAAG